MGITWDRIGSDPMLPQRFPQEPGQLRAAINLLQHALIARQKGRRVTYERKLLQAKTIIDDLVKILRIQEEPGI